MHVVPLFFNTFRKQKRHNIPTLAKLTVTVTVTVTHVLCPQYLEHCDRDRNCDTCIASSVLGESIVTVTVTVTHVLCPQYLEHCDRDRDRDKCITSSVLRAL